MHFKTLNGKTFEADSLEGAAEYLWKMMFSPESTLEAWMQGSAQRAKAWNGSVIRTSSADAHVEDLIAAGLLEQLD